jgi:hypothetical protein
LFPFKWHQIQSRTRRDQHLRHAPLWLINAAISHPAKGDRAKLVDSIDQVCQRADDMGELLSQYWDGGKKKPLAAVLKRGLAKAFPKFDEYRLAKYAKRGAIRLRDVMFLVHPKPRDEAQAKLWKQLAADTMDAPDTWEVALTRGEDKNTAFTRLLNDNMLLGMATLRNVRNMKDAGVDKKLVGDALLKQAGKSGILPFQYVSAARACPAWEDIIEAAMLASMQAMPKLPGKTLLVIDTSGSMNANLSAKSTLNRLDAAGAFAALAAEICEEPIIYATAGNDYNRTHKTIRIPSSRRGFGLIDYVCGKFGALTAQIGGGGIFLKQAMDFIENDCNETGIDRVIVFTDEQDCDTSNAGSPAQAKLLGKNNYIMNVATYKNGIAYSGFSEKLFRYIAAAESSNNQ